jgi:hypothetical protein
VGTPNHLIQAVEARVAKKRRARQVSIHVRDEQHLKLPKSLAPLVQKSGAGHVSEMSSPGRITAQPDVT